jgi:hypothetical protein
MVTGKEFKATRASCAGSKSGVGVLDLSSTQFEGSQRGGAKKCENAAVEEVLHQFKCDESVGRSSGEVRTAGQAKAGRELRVLLCQAR